MKKKPKKAQSGKVITGDIQYDNLLSKRDSIVQRAGTEGYRDWDIFLKQGIQKIKTDRLKNLQNSIEVKPPSIPKDFKPYYPVIEDNMGQLKHPGKVTKINSNKITMKGVNYPVLGISDMGDKKLMLPNQDYTFNGDSVTEFPLGKSGIHIKPENKGKFNALKKRTGKSTEELTHSKNPLTRKRAIFAQNDSKWNKGQMGTQVPIETNWGSENIYAPGHFSQQGQINQFNSTLPQQPQQKKGMFNKIGGAQGILQGINTAAGASMLDQQQQGGPSAAQTAVGQFGPWGQAISTVSQIGTGITNQSDNAVVGTLGTAIFDPGSVWTNKDLSKKDRILGGIDPIYGGYKAFKARQAKKEQADRLKKLVKKASDIEDVDANKRKYFRPEDQLFDPDQMGSTFGAGTNYLKDGGKLAMGGDLETYWGGGAAPMSTNPYLPDGGQTVMFNGASHEDGGIGVKFGGTPVEVEGGEPAVKLKDEKGKNNLTVFGNMKIPPFGVLELNDPKAKGKKFKNYIADLSRTEAKQNNIVNKNLKMVDNLDVSTPYDKLTLNAGQAMLEGANMKLKDIAQKKQTASMVQNVILETADEFGIESDALAKGNIKKAKNGIMIAQDGKRISRAEVEEYLKQGYQPDPTNPNRLFKKSSIPGETKTVNIGAPGKGSEEFNRAFADARRKKLGEFTFRGKKYTTDLFNSKTKTVTSPGSESVDYIDIYDPEARQANKFTPSSSFNFGKQETPETQSSGLNLMDVINTTLPYLRPSNQIPLDPNQLAGERYALATNQLEGVKAQLYHPLLENVSDISLQDQLNANQADFNSIQRSLGTNPAASASLAGQKYAANTGVLGEQFRHNQAQRQGVYNRNRGVLNDAQLKNLGILDEQYVRQSQAKSNTKATAQAALNSMSDKIQRHKLENKTLGIYENLYNYRYAPKGQAINLNPFAQFQFPSAGDTNLQYLDSLVPAGKEPEFNSKGELKDVGSKPKRNGSIVRAIKNL